MLHHTFYPEPNARPCFSMVRSLQNYNVLLVHLVNPTLATYREAHALICDGALTVYIYETVCDKVIEAMNGT